MKSPNHKIQHNKEKVILIPKKDGEQDNKKLKDKRSRRERG